MERLKKAIEELAYENKSDKPSLLWLSIEQKGDYEGDRSSPHYPHIGYFALKGDLQVYFPNFEGRIGIGKEIYFIYLDAYHRYEKMEEGRITGMTNPFKNINKAYDIYSEKTVSELTNTSNANKALKEMGWSYTQLLFGVILSPILQDPLGGVYALRKSAFGEYRNFLNYLSKTQKSLKAGIVRLTTRKEKSQYGSSYYLPSFQLLDFDDEKVKKAVDKFGEEKVLEVVKNYRQTIDAYVNFYESQFFTDYTKKIEHEETDEKTDDDGWNLFEDL